MTSPDEHYPNKKPRMSDFSAEEPEISYYRDIPTLTYRGLLYHSKINPVRESKRKLESAIDENTEIALFIGTGLGYDLKVFYEAYNIPAVVFEPDSSIRKLWSKAGIWNPDSPSCKESRASAIDVVCKDLPDMSRIKNLLQSFDTARIAIISHRPSLISDSRYTEILNMILEYIGRRQTNEATNRKFDELWAKNLVRNMSFMNHCSPLPEKIEFPVPAVILGAGPSLYSDLRTIFPFREKCLLIATDTAFSVCENVGLRPDIVLSVDPQPVNRIYLRKASVFPILIFDPVAHPFSWPVDKAFYFHSFHNIYNVLDTQFGFAARRLAYGGSVSTTATDLGFQLKCPKIFLAGQDLSFPNYRAHSPGATFEEEVRFREDRFYRQELLNFKQLNALPGRFLSGRTIPVRSNDKMLVFLKWFQQKAVMNPDRLVNITSEGANIQGIPFWSEDQLESYFSNFSHIEKKAEKLSKLFRAKPVPFLGSMTQLQGKSIVEVLPKPLQHKFRRMIERKKNTPDDL